MYRLVLYSLIALLSVAVVLCLLGILSFSPWALLFTAVFLSLVCVVANTLIAKAFDAPTNVESAYITALILALILTPATSLDEVLFLFWVAVLSMASKYILAIRKKHIFNPVAIAVVITTFTLGESANWWVGTAWMMPFVACCGFLIIRKLRFEDLAWGFFLTAIVVSCGITLFKDGNVVTTLTQISLHSSFLFLGTVMLTEPYTLPPTKQLQMVYGAIVGFLAVPQVHIGNLYFAPELALCIGNVFAYIVSPKIKLVVRLKEKMQVSKDVIDFLFTPSQKVAFTPGQYMEWTIPHHMPDSRGNRRFFTIASSPTEDTIRLGVKFYEKGSSYKQVMQQLDATTPVVGAQLAGNFTLPKDATKKLVFIAGGIGVTPFRSMIKYLIDTNQKRDIVLLYSNKTEDEIVYQDVFRDAEKIGIKIVYVLTAVDMIAPTWQGKRGRIDAAMITAEVPDFQNRIYYLSGPYAMITAFEKVLKDMGIRGSQIKKDFFPGLV